jgi:translation initiation factor 1
MAKQTGNSSLVYSTDSGRICPDCRQPQVQCICHVRKPVVPADGFVRVWQESKGRGGKTVTLVRGLPLEDEALKALAKQLRSACGSGGTVKDGTIEVQGEHGERVQQMLQTQGYKIKNGPGSGK